MTLVVTAPVFTVRFTLLELRTAAKLSRRALADASGISAVTIGRIENNESKGIHTGVAWALADTLSVRVESIHWPADLTHRGRPPKTGRPTTPQVHRTQVCCNSCFILKSLAGTCEC